MTLNNLVVRPQPQPFTPPLTSHPLLQVVPLSLLLGDAVDDMQEPRLAKRYGLDQLTPAVQQQAASEARNRPLSTSSSWLNGFLRWWIHFFYNKPLHPLASNTGISLHSLSARRVLVARAQTSSAASGGVPLRLGPLW